MSTKSIASPSREAHLLLHVAQGLGDNGRNSLVDEGLELNLAAVQLDVGLATLQRTFDLVSTSQDRHIHGR